MKKTCKSIFRRTLSFMVTAAMCLSLLPAAAFAADGESTGEAADSIVQVDTTPEVSAEQQTDPSEDGEEPSEPEPAEGEGETEDETQQPEPSEAEEQPSEPETTESEGEEDETQTSQPEETPSDDEEKEEPADHVHNEDGWSCAWSECIHEHGPECYVPGEDGGEDVLNCAHVCGEECLANTEGFWICTEPEEDPPVYATVEELEAAFEAVSETDDVDEALAAIDEYLRIFDLLSPEDQEANAEAKEAALAYQETLKGSLEGIPDPDVETLALISGEEFTVKVVKVVNGNEVDNVTLTTKCLQRTGHSGYNHSTNLRDLANSSGFSGYKGYNWSKYTTVPSTYTEGLAPNNNYASVHYNITGSAPYKANETLFLFFENTPTYTVTVEYIYENGTTAAPTQTKSGTSGTPYSWTSPTISGYTPDKSTVSGTITKDETITVTYKQNNYTYQLTWDYDGGKVGNDSSRTKTETTQKSTHTFYEDAPDYGNPKPTKDGYRFAGWDYTGNGTFTVSNGQINMTGILNGTVSGTLKAKWELIPKPDIQVTKTVDGSSEVKPGSNVTFNITVKNTGNVTLSNITVTDTLPGSMSYVSSTPEGNHVRQTVRWTISSLAVNETKDFQITAKVAENANGSLINNVSAVTGTTKDDGSAIVTVEKPNPKLTGIEKELVGATVNGETADINKLSVAKGDVVVLRYKITVTGDEGAKYTVEDEGAALENGSSWSGTLDSSKKAEIFVTKTVTATETGTLTVTNTAYVKPGEGTGPIDPNDPEEGHPSDKVETDIPVEPNPKLAGIEKELVGVTVNGETADVNKLSVTKGDVVVLRYKITVTGDEGAEYTVEDEGAALENGSSWSGTLDSSKKAEIFVTKTVTATEAGTLTVTNTAYVKPGEGTDPVDPNDPDKGHPSEEVEIDIPVKEPNPKLTGITKRLVLPEGLITVKRGESVELVYEITVTGEKGAKYEVSDPEAGDTTWKGTIDESGKAVITVSKTITPTEEQKGTITVKNTAYVKPDGDGTDPIKPGDPDPDKDPTDPEKGYPSNEVETEITIIEPNPKLKSIVKKLVTPEPITVRVGENVTLEYTITITGDEGAEYKVTDDGAELKDGSSWDGKLGESGEAVITVTKTVTPTEAGTMTVENTAFVKPGEGTDPIKPVDPENPDEPVEPEPSNTVTTDITVTDGREITITWLRNYSRDDETIIKRDQRVPANITSDEIGARYPGEDQIPNREGYEFIGWGERVTDELGNITIRAQWRYVGPSGPTTPTGPTDPTPGDSDTDDDSDPDPDPDPTPVRRVTVNVPDAPTPLAEIGETPVPLASNPSDLIDIFDDDVPLAGGAQTGNNDALWYLLAALSLAGLGIVKLLEKKNTTK